MRVQTGNNVGIGGFIITGTAQKHVLVRAIGPSLTESGVPDALADPVLELHGPDGFVTITSDNWRDDPTQEALIDATGIPPRNDLESAIEARLFPGAYTAIVRGKGNTSGVGLVEVYDLNQDALSKLSNLSTRAFVSTDDNIVIAGFVLSNSLLNNRVIVRGIGPSLTALGVPGALANPALELRDNNGALLAANNDWQDNPAQAAELTAAGLAPTNQLESGIAATLPPGVYTALLSGQNNGTGLGLVEIYSAPPVAGNQVPFNGTVSGQIPADMGPPVPGSGGCVFNFFVSNSGNGNQLGDFTGTSNFIPNVCDGSYTGSFHWIAANGDSISGPFFGQLIPTATPGVFDNNETAIVTSGTGRFTNATGTFTLSGQVNFNTLSFVLPFQGTISTP
ncbi:MAG TPA: hypothetical protein VNT99_06480 [Methylomirabilota bacterium]|nr:hypothetical protein [Methylomirabilota bacterium]